MKPSQNLAFQTKLKNFFRRNLLSLLFIVFLIVGGFFFWFEGYSQKQKAKDLIQFVSQNLAAVQQDIQSIILVSQSLENNQQNYAQVIDSLKKIDSKVEIILNQVPSKLNTEENRPVLNSFFELLEYLKENSLKFNITKYSLMQQNLENYKNYGQLATLVQQNELTAAKLQQINASGSEVVKINTQLSTVVEDKQLSLDYKQKEQLLLRQIKILQEQSKAELTPENIGTIKAVYAQNLPAFSAKIEPLDRNEIFTKRYNFLFDNLENEMAKLSFKNKL